MAKISIEVGHGGKDAGAVNGNFTEKDITLVVSLELKRQLERHGQEVLISRETDIDDSAKDFFAKAKAWKPDIGISVHVNAGGGNGFEVFARQNTVHSRNSYLLCSEIINEVKSLGQVIRSGCPKNSDFMMDKLLCPTAYTELGFIDNPTDRAWWDTADKQKAFATAYAKGILKYWGVKWVEENAASTVLYKVQLGAFSIGANADNLQAKLRKAGFKDAFVQKEDGYFKVQTGAFGIRDNALKMQSTLRSSGFKDAYVKMVKG